MNNPLHRRLVALATAAALTPFAAAAQGRGEFVQEFFVGADGGTITHKNLCDDARAGFELIETTFDGYVSDPDPQIPGFAGNYTFEPDGLACDDHSGFLRLVGGAKINDFLTVEFGGSIYEEFQTTGTISAASTGQIPISTNIKVGFSSFDLSLLGSYPITDTVSVFGRAGVMMWETDVEHSISGIPAGNTGLADEVDGINEMVPQFVASNDGTDLLYGVGASAELLDNFYLNMWWSRIDADVEIDAFAFGASYHF